MMATQSKPETPKDFEWGQIYCLSQIYCLTSPSGKVYIGQTVKYCSGGKPRGVETRWKQHVNDARLFKEGKKTASCRRLVYAINKYGADNFEVEVLDECHKDLLDDNEEKYISMFDSCNPENGYNIRKGGRGDWNRNPDNFEKNLEKMIEARRVVKFEPMTPDEQIALQKRLVSLRNKYSPGHKTKDKILPLYVRSFTCNRGYSGYKVQVPGFAIKTIRSGFTRDSDGALKEALDYLETCMKAKNVEKTFSETTKDGPEGLANPSTV